MIVKLLVDFGIFDEVKKFGTNGYPMFGTCAGCIMMAKSIDGMPDQKTLDLSDYTVSRSAPFPCDVSLFRDLWSGIQSEEI